jgi:hypothetical protein
MCVSRVSEVVNRRVRSIAPATTHVAAHIDNLKGAAPTRELAEHAALPLAAVRNDPVPVMLQSPLNFEVLQSTNRNQQQLHASDQKLQPSFKIF